MQLTKRIAIAAGALTLGTAGIAAAAGTPDAADDGLTKASAQVGIELPASQDSHPVADDQADESDVEDDAVESEDEVKDETDADAEDEGLGPVDNHGAEVSAVATSDETTGRDHGIAVSEVARQGHGQGPAGEGSTTHGRP
jgi:hypothetical protein